MHSAEANVNLKDPWLAGLLALILPGAGHLYQGRLFKAGVYAGCILGLFFSGMALAGWKAVQAPPLTHRNIRSSRLETLKFLAQAPVGLPTWYAVVQSHRYYSDENQATIVLDEPISASFKGAAELTTEGGVETVKLTGTVTLRPARGLYGTETIDGSFEGSIDGKPATLGLKHVDLEKQVRAERMRMLTADLVQSRAGREETVGRLRGGIPRPFLDWFEVPLDDAEQQDLHRQLGKYHELAMVFTWVAGLLNVLAIWDAIEGPAYGYGDEEAASAEGES